MLLIKKIIIVFLSSIFCYSVLINDLFSQSKGSIETEYEKLKGVYENEMENISSSPINISQYHISFCKLPAWFFEIPKGERDTTYSIGISDPKFPEVDRKFQAISRAMGIGALMKNLKIQMMRDVYYADDTETKSANYISKLEELYQLRHSLIEKLSWDLVSVDTTEFGEVVVLIKIYPDNNYTIEHDNKSTLFEIDCFNAEYQKNGKFDIVRNVEISITNINSHSSVGESSYSYNQINKIADIISQYDKNEIFINANHFKYKPFADSLICDISKISGGSFYYGLWFGYLSALLNTLQSIILPEHILIQNVDDYYSERFQDFSRESFAKETSLELESICIRENQIFVNLTPNK